MIHFSLIILIVEYSNVNKKWSSFKIIKNNSKFIYLLKMYKSQSIITYENIFSSKKMLINFDE